MKHLLQGLLIILVGGLLLLSIPAGAWLYETKACKYRWPERRTTYELLAGCLVQSKSGEMVPERAVREVGQ
jgi:hypothetical protein